jgi:MFS family permease
MTETKLPSFNSKHLMLIIVASLGYFVDIYDLILFNVVKKQSLLDIGVPDAQIMDVGMTLFNWQMAGMLIGGIIWGILGDTKGRVKVLFGSILMYSLANMANAFAHDITTYSIIRFIAGIGLAGELGAGITLVAESMKTEHRGYGTMIIVTFGALGAVFAALVGDHLGWQNAYIVGGALGLLLLLLRIGTLESSLFKNLHQSKVPDRGNLLMLFKQKGRFFKYLSCILIGLPIWFMIGLLVATADKFAIALKVQGTVLTSSAVMFAYIGLSVGDLISGLLSQLLKSRKKVVLLYLIASTILIAIYLLLPGLSATVFYAMCFLLGAGTGYWALFVTIAAEQFGTNIRSTVTTTVPNFVRGSVVVITIVFKFLKNDAGMSMITAALIIGSVCMLLAFAALANLRETFSKELDYYELS